MREPAVDWEEIIHYPDSEKRQHWLSNNRHPISCYLLRFSRGNPYQTATGQSASPHLKCLPLIFTHSQSQTCAKKKVMNTAHTTEHLKLLTFFSFCCRFCRNDPSLLVWINYMTPLAHCLLTSSKHLLSLVWKSLTKIWLKQSFSRPLSGEFLAFQRRNIASGRWYSSEICHPRCTSTGGVSPISRQSCYINFQGCSLFSMILCTVQACRLECFLSACHFLLKSWNLSILKLWRLSFWAE